MKGRSSWRRGAHVRHFSWRPGQAKTDSRRTWRAASRGQVQLSGQHPHGGYTRHNSRRGRFSVAANPSVDQNKKESAGQMLLSATWLAYLWTPWRIKALCGHSQASADKGEGVVGLKAALCKVRVPKADCSLFDIPFKLQPVGCSIDNLHSTLACQPILFGAHVGSTSHDCNQEGQARKASINKLQAASTAIPGLLVADSRESCLHTGSRFCSSPCWQKAFCRSRCSIFEVAPPVTSRMSCTSNPVLYVRLRLA